MCIFHPARTDRGLFVTKPMQSCPHVFAYIPPHNILFIFFLQMQNPKKAFHQFTCLSKPRTLDPKEEGFHHCPCLPHKACGQLRKQALHRGVGVCRFRVQGTWGLERGVKGLLLGVWSVEGLERCSRTW